MKKFISIFIIIMLILPHVTVIAFGGGELRVHVPETHEVGGGGGASDDRDPPEHYEPSEDGEESGHDYSPPVHVIITVHDWYSKIYGNVFEDKPTSYVSGGEVTRSDGKLENTIRTGNNGVVDPGEGIYAIKVTLTNGKQEYVTYTDANGYYQFLEGTVPPGRYRVKIDYGAFPEYASFFNYKSIANALKYNGQDYSGTYKAVTSGEEGGGGGYITGSEYYYEFNRKVIQSGKGMAQIFLVIDFSPSMYESATQYLSRIEAVKESAKIFIETLFEKERNMVVGIIGFSGKAAIIKNLTYRKEDLITALDNFSLDFVTYKGVPIFALNSLAHEDRKGGTNISRGIIKARNAFINRDKEDSNRIIILFTDGVPLAHDNVPELFGNEPQSSFYAKLNQVVRYTRNDLISAINDGITLVTVLTELTNPEEIYYANKVFRYDDRHSNWTLF